MKSLQKHAVCVAYASIGLLFIVSAIGKITDFSGSVAYVVSKGLPLAEVLIVLAIIFELFGGLSLFFKKRICLGASMLIVFLILATLMFHVGDGQLTPFLRNLAIFGGLLLVKNRECDCSSCEIPSKKSKSSKSCCGGGCKSS